MKEREITFEDLQRVNETIKTTEIKGKEYAEVNQRIKAFRMLYPNGIIETEMLSNENGICIFKAMVGYREGNELYKLSTGTAYEKEDSTFINKTSYIENCETSAVGRALGMAGFGIDTSVASAEEVQNAIANQNKDITLEEAQEYVLTFGKHAGEKLSEVDKSYLVWLRENGKDDYIKALVNLLIPLPSEEEQKEMLELIEDINELLDINEIEREKLYKHYGVSSNNEMTLEQLRDAKTRLENMQ